MPFNFEFAKFTFFSENDHTEGDSLGVEYDWCVLVRFALNPNGPIPLAQIKVLGPDVKRSLLESSICGQAREDFKKIYREIFKARKEKLRSYSGTEVVALYHFTNSGVRSLSSSENLVEKIKLVEAANNIHSKSISHGALKQLEKTLKEWKSKQDKRCEHAFDDIAPDPPAQPELSQ